MIDAVIGTEFRASRRTDCCLCFWAEVETTCKKGLISGRRADRRGDFLFVQA